MSVAATGVSRWALVAAVAALLALHYVMAISAASKKSMTFDEMAHLTAGYTYWAFNDYRLHPENGNWPQRLGALPAVLAGASFPSLDQPAWATSNVYAMGDQFLYFSGNDPDVLLSRGRAVMALLGVALGALVFVWARRLVSLEGAWVSLVLFVFGPTFLAHGPLVTSDMAAALFFTAAVAATWVVMHRVTPLTVLGTGLLVAGALLSKLSGPILAPIALVMLAVRLIGGRPLLVGVGGRFAEHQGRSRQLGILLAAGVAAGLVAWTLLWASYGFRYTAFAAAVTGNEAFLGRPEDPMGGAGWILSTMRQWRLLPEAYIYAFSLTLQFASERAAFLRGQFSTTGWWWFFPYAFAVKTTIPAMLVGVLAVAGLVARWRTGGAGESMRDRVRASLYAGTPLVALVVLYWAFALTSNLNIGHRHLLPTYPALCILAGGAAFWIRPLLESPTRAGSQSGRERRKQRARARERGRTAVPAWAASVATIGLVAWHAAESVAVSSGYLAYFNQFAGGPSQGYRHLVDSSLDWGQDLPALARWLESERLDTSREGVYLSYFGTARPEHYGVRATPLAGFIDRRPPEPPVPLHGGVYCISATMLNVVSHSFYRPEYEENYQAGVQNLGVFARASGNEAEWAALMRRTGEDYWRQLFVQFDQLRTGRLMAYLRGREPDALVESTILIYRLTDADVDAALRGPVPGAEAAR